MKKQTIVFQNTWVALVVCGFGLSDLGTLELTTDILDNPMKIMYSC